MEIAACLFGLYLVGFKFYSVTTDQVAPVVKFESVSPKRKNTSPYLSYIQIWTQILLAETRALKNANLNLRIAQQLITCSGVGEGLGEEGETLRK